MAEPQGEERLLAGRRILVGVTGGIAAYKVCSLVSRLVQDGAEVRVVMTEAATRFVGPVTFRALTGHPPASDMWQDLPEAGNHVSLARFAELVVVAPASANTLAKVAHGLCDNLLTTTIVATQAPVLFAPAMNAVMWQNPTTQANVARLQKLGYRFVMPEEGWLACGESGPGRMADPETIRAAIEDLLRPPGGPLAGKQVLITAGPTREWLDPVRFLSNPSSGKMGMALARVARQRGAQVRLVLGPTHLPPPPGVEVTRVETAEEMRQAVAQHLPGTDVFVGAAAVADYRPETRANQKQKKSGEPLELRLLPTTDIIHEVAHSPERPAVVVGFAAESEDLENQAWAKLERKGLDLIVANDITQPGVGFGEDMNEVLILDRKGRRERLSRRSKQEVAERVFDRVQQWLAGGNC